MIGAGEHVRDALDGADVERDVLTGSTVAAGRATHQTTVLVEQGDREAVDLELAQVVHRGRAELAPYPRGPGREGRARARRVPGALPVRAQDRRPRDLVAVPERSTGAWRDPWRRPDR